MNHTTTWVTDVYSAATDLAVRAHGVRSDGFIQHHSGQAGKNSGATERTASRPCFLGR